MKDCRGEMLVRVRKGLASDQERTAFEAHIGSCESCQMSLEVMGDFDAVGEAETGDSELVGRIAARAANLHGSSPRRSSRVARRIWPLAVAAFVLTGVAIAGGAIRLALKPDPQPQSSPTDTTSPPLHPNRASAPKPSAEVPETPSPGAPQESETARSGKITDGATPQTTAAEVYRVANDARRAGRTHQAILGYGRLQRGFPSSPEAHAAHVSLGGLLLKNGSSSAALAQFDAYLGSGGGRLAAEALFGRAQALRALGRSAEEAQNLQRLVKTYPHSAYATHAQRRLHQLH